MTTLMTMPSNRVPAGNAALRDFAHVQGDDDFAHLAQHSPLAFTAYERPLYYKGRDGTEYSNTKHKALVRVWEGAPVTLNVVRDTYKVVQNDELFETIHKALLKTLDADDFKSMFIRDKVSYFGAVCFREYVFPNIAFASPEREKIAFRIVIQNGFGTGAIKLLAGAIDFFCTNGVVIGDYTSTYAKHTKGLELSKFSQAVEGSVHVFWKNRELFEELGRRKVLNDDHVQKWFEDRFGERLGARLHRQYLIEAATRGRTLWAVFSAMTYYASHTEGQFGVRNTGNDHTAATLFSREQQVRRIMQDRDTLFQLAA